MFQTTNQLMNMCLDLSWQGWMNMKKSLKFVAPYVWICWATATRQQQLRLRLCACRRGGRTVCPRDRSPTGSRRPARMHDSTQFRCAEWLNKIARTIKHQVYHHISSYITIYHWYLLVQHMVFKWIDIIGIHSQTTYGRSVSRKTKAIFRVYLCLFHIIWEMVWVLYMVLYVYK